VRFSDVTRILRYGSLVAVISLSVGLWAATVGAQPVSSLVVQHLPTRPASSRPTSEPQPPSGPPGSPPESAVSIVNNTMAEIPRYSLQITGDRIDDLDIRNNVFYNTGPIRYEDTQLRAGYNGWFNAAERIEGPHDVVGSNPQFVAPGDYHLRAISPAVDVGDAASLLTHDFDGNLRPYGPGVDLGAFEVQEPPPVTDLWASRGVTTTGVVTVTLIWTAPGRVGQSSTAHHYELRYDDRVFTQQSWDQGIVVDANIIAGQPGQMQQTTVSLPWSGSGHLYFALRVFDVGGRVSEVSNAAFWPFESSFLPAAMARAGS
jgi:hypothetical protein